MAKKNGGSKKRTGRSQLLADMDRYRKLQPRMWRDEKVRQLSRAQPNAQTLWVYLLTGPESILIPGVIPVGEMALAEALGWSGEGFLEGFREAFGELLRKGMCEADWEARLVWIPKAIHNNPPINANVVIGWSKAWPEVPECALKDKIAGAIKSFIRLSLPDYEAAMVRDYGKGLDNCFPNGSGKGSLNGSDNQEQEQEAGAGVLKDSPPFPPYCPDWWRDDYADPEDQRIADLTLRKHQRLLVRYLDAGLLTEAEVTKELSYGRMVLFEHWRIDEKNREAFRPIWREERDRAVYLRYPEDAPDGFQPRDRFDEALDAMLARIETKAA